jgi:hypothetical protein
MCQETNINLVFTNEFYLAITFWKCQRIKIKVVIFKTKTTFEKPWHHKYNSGCVIYQNIKSHEKLFLHFDFQRKNFFFEFVLYPLPKV